MTTTIGLEVSYGQLAVFTRSLAQPFSHWTDQHVDQGFAWRPGSVSFRTMVEAGRHSIEIDIVDHVGTVHADAVRAIEGPFDVSVDGEIEIGSITGTAALSVPAGSFLLRSEFLRLPDKAEQCVRLLFSKCDTHRFAVLCADDALSIGHELLTSAEAAAGQVGRPG